jgi:hypothetical protein
VALGVGVHEGVVVATVVARLGSAMNFTRSCTGDVSFIETWIRALPPVAYAEIYARDGLRCTNPLCTRRDCQPHHNRFRAHGGGDEPENLTTLCTWCHLEGVHGGRIAVPRTASSGTWANTPP